MKQESVSDSRGVFLVMLLGHIKKKEKKDPRTRQPLYLFDPYGQAVTHLLPSILFSALQEIPFYVLIFASVPTEENVLCRCILYALPFKLTFVQQLI